MKRHVFILGMGLLGSIIVLFNYWMAVNGWIYYSPKLDSINIYYLAGFMGVLTSSVVYYKEYQKTKKYGKEKE